MFTELIGWCSAVILLLTIGRQVYTQWRTRSAQGLSRWLFIGQLAASTGFVVYSWLLGNWVFMATNLLMLATAAVGQWVYLRNVQRAQSGAAAGAPESSSSAASEGCAAAQPWVYSIRCIDQ